MMFLKVTQNGTGWIRKFKEQMQNTGSYMSCKQYKVAHIINHLPPEFLFNSMATFIWSLFTDILFRVASLKWDWC